MLVRHEFRVTGLVHRSFWLHVLGTCYPRLDQELDALRALERPEGLCALFPTYWEWGQCAWKDARPDTFLQEARVIAIPRLNYVEGVVCR